MNPDNERLTGLLAATFTPMRNDGSINVDQIPPMVAHLKRTGVSGLYVCGSTGEGMSLTTAERMELTEVFVQATAGELKVVAQVGHNSVEEARRLAQHAWKAGADVISATAPSYYKINRVEVLVDTMAHIASAAPEAPFYYYHIPSLTGSSINITRFMELASRKIPNLVGLKYTAPLIHEFQACKSVGEGRLDVLWGTDEMLLSALVVGATGAIGSTYNVKAMWDQRIIAAYEAGEMEAAAEMQMRAVEFIDILLAYPFHAAVKSLLTRMGIECGPCRLPIENLSTAEESQLHSRIEESVVGEWLFKQASRPHELGTSMRRTPFSRPKHDPSARTSSL